MNEMILRTDEIPQKQLCELVIKSGSAAVLNNRMDHCLAAKMVWFYTQWLKLEVADSRKAR